MRGTRSKGLFLLRARGWGFRASRIRGFDELYQTRDGVDLVRIVCGFRGRPQHMKPPSRSTLSRSHRSRCRSSNRLVNWPLCGGGSFVQSDEAHGIIFIKVKMTDSSSWLILFLDRRGVGFDLDFGDYRVYGVVLNPETEALTLLQPQSPRPKP